MGMGQEGSTTSRGRLLLQHYISGELAIGCASDVDLRVELIYASRTYPEWSVEEKRIVTVDVRVIVGFRIYES
jgi:hypothetical protein